MAHYDCDGCGAAGMGWYTGHAEGCPEDPANKVVKNKMKKVVAINSNWVEFVCNHTRDEIVGYFQGCPTNSQFTAEAGFEYIESDVYFWREETDEEYELRIAQEARQIKAAAELGAQVNAANRKNVEDAIAQLQEQLRSMP